MLSRVSTERGARLAPLKTAAAIEGVRIGGNMRFTGLALGLSLLAAPAIFAQNGAANGHGGGNNGNHFGGFKGAPEPLTLLGLAVGAGGVALLARRRRP
jgi:hypothetical protein